MPKDNINYKRYNVAVPSSSRRGEHNFRINEHTFECFCKATFIKTRDWQRHLSTYHNLPIESIREIMGRDFHAQSSTVFNGTVGDDQAYISDNEEEDDDDEDGDDIIPSFLRKRGSF